MLLVHDHELMQPMHDHDLNLAADLRELLEALTTTSTSPPTLESGMNLPKSLPLNSERERDIPDLRKRPRRRRGGISFRRHSPSA